MPASKSGIWKNPVHGTGTGYSNYRCRCAECRAWNAAQGRARRAAKPEEGRRYASAYYKARPELRRGQTFRRYSLTSEQYQEMLSSQGGGCAICGMTIQGKHLHIDHDHSCCQGQKSCGECVRGLLCGPCNSGIALFKDSEALLCAAAKYLKKD